MNQCECGQIAGPQGYCLKCLAEFNIHINSEHDMEQFEMNAMAPRTAVELETEHKISESLNQEPTHTNTQPRRLKMSSKLTDVRVYPVNDQGNLKAWVSIELNGDYVTRSIRLMDSKNGLFLGFPEKYNPDAKVQNRGISFPTSLELRQKVTDAAIAKYNGEEVAFETTKEEVAETIDS